MSELNDKITIPERIELIGHDRLLDYKSIEAHERTMMIHRYSDGSIYIKAIGRDGNMVFNMAPDNESIKKLEAFFSDGEPDEEQERENIEI